MWRPTSPEHDRGSRRRVTASVRWGCERGLRIAIPSAVAVVMTITAATARADPVPVLGADNVLSATTSGSVEVEISEPILIDAAKFGNTSVSLTGKGPVVGFVLRSLPVSATSNMVTVLRSGVASATCGRPCAANDGLRVFGWSGPNEDRFFELPAGRYLWSAITEGEAGSVRATLHLENLSGSREFVSTAPFAARALEMAARPGSWPYSKVFAETASLATRGMIFMEIHTAEGGLGGSQELCVFRGAAEPSAFERGCPGSYDGASGSGTIALALLETTAGVWSVGGNATDSDSATTMVAAWIPLDAEPPSNPPPSSPAPPEVRAPEDTSTIRVIRRVLSARAIRRVRAVRLAVRSEGRLANLTGRLTSAGLVYARGRLRAIEGRTTLTMTLHRRVPPGTYKLSLEATDKGGKTVKVSLRIRVK